jgi:hypothetical protein
MALIWPWVNGNAFCTELFNSLSSEANIGYICATGISEGGYLVDIDA